MRIYYVICEGMFEDTVTAGKIATFKYSYVVRGKPTAAVVTALTQNTGQTYIDTTTFSLSTVSMTTSNDNTTVTFTANNTGANDCNVIASWSVSVTQGPSV
jgi:hypothetical protein